MVFPIAVAHPLGVQREPQSAMVKARTTTIERGSLHGYVTRKHAHFNQKISISHTGGNLSSNSGLVLVREFLDLDSTHSDTYGNQEEAAYNGHYGTTGYHPLVAFDGLTGDFLKANCARGMCTRPARPGGARLPPRVCRHQPRGVRAGGMGIPNLPAAGDDGELHQGGKARLLPGQDGQLRLPREPGPHDGKPLGLQYRQLPAYPVPFRPGRRDRESERS